MSAQYTIEQLYSCLNWMKDEGLVERSIDPQTGEDVWRIAPGAENFEFSE